MGLSARITRAKGRPDADLGVVPPPAYKRTDLETLPKDWKVAEVGDLNPFVTSGSRGWARFYSETGAAFIRITNLSRESIYLDLGDLKFVRLAPAASSEAARTGLRDGDLLISITADIGIIGFVDASLEKPAFINQHIALVRFDDALASSRFIAYYLASEKPQRLFVASMDVGAKAGMNLTTIRKIRLVLPPSHEQRAIAEALSDVDGLLGGLEALIAKKRAIKQAAKQQLLTGKTRLPGFSGESERRALGDVAEIKTGPFGSALHERDYVSDGTPIITVEHLGERGVIHANLPRVSDGDRARLSMYTLVVGDIVFSRVGSIDRNALIRSTEDGWLFSGRLLRVRPNSTRVSSSYLSHYFHGEDFKARVREVAVGQTMASLNTRILQGVEVFFPELPEQTAIAAVLSDMDAEIAALEQRLEKTRAIKQGMMQQLLTGRVRLVKPSLAEVGG